MALTSSGPIWTMNDLYFYLFASDVDGEFNAEDPLLEYCYLQSVDVSGSCPVVYRERHGKATREQVQPGTWDAFTINLSSLYIGYETGINLTEIFNREKWLAAIFLFRSPVPGIKANETRIAKKMKATNFHLKGSDNQDMIVDINFDASEFS